MNRITYPVKRFFLRVLVWSLKLETAWDYRRARRARARGQRLGRVALSTSLLRNEAVDRLEALENPAREIPAQDFDEAAKTPDVDPSDDW